MEKSERESSQRETRYEFVGGPPGDDRSRGRSRSPDQPLPVFSSLERVIETLANTQVQNTLMFSEFQVQATRQQEVMAEQMQLDRELAREKVYAACW